jgi:hypothetical protein
MPSSFSEISCPITEAFLYLMIQCPACKCVMKRSEDFKRVYCCGKTFEAPKTKIALVPVP